MSLLTLVQRASLAIGVTSPGTVIGNNDLTVQQMLELANQEGEELRDRHMWSSLLIELTHTTTAAEDQGLITALGGGITDFDFDAGFVDQTIYNRSDQVRVPGSVSPQRWQLLQASTISGPYNEFRIRQKRLLLIPTPTAGETLGMEYKSLNWCESSGGTGQSAWAVDTDVGRLSERLMRLGVIWRFKEAKGLDYAEAMRTYELAVQTAYANDAGNQTLFMDSGEPNPDLLPIRAPEGSWPL